MIKPWSYKRNHLYFDQMPIATLIKDVATPLYLYSQTNIEHYYDEFSNAAHQNQMINPMICYALKANPNKEIINILKKKGSGADVVSGGELQRALECGISPEKIVFSGVGKTGEEIQFALKQGERGVFSFNVESIEECRLINQIAGSLGMKARIALRVNPNVVTKTHKYISTGDKIHKFGIQESEVKEILIQIKKFKSLELCGLSVHIGSQLTCLKATQKAIKRLCLLIKELKITLSFVDLGGGLGINYTDGKIPSAFDYMKSIADILKKELYPFIDCSSFQTLFEPGRYLVARSGLFITRVIRIKKSSSISFAVIDGAMNDFIRPILYDAYHEIITQKIKASQSHYDIVGPICESTDCFAKERLLSTLVPNDLLCFSDAGAYGASMASTYNLRRLPNEYIINLKGELKKLTNH